MSDEVADRSLEEWRQIALDQAAEIARQAQRNRDLIGERDKAKDAREAALVLAGEFARRAGADPSKDDVMKWADQWWKQIGRIDGDRSHMQGQRWEAQRVAEQLLDLAAGKRVTDLDKLALAKAVGLRLSAVLTAQNNPAKAGELFALPSLPVGQPSLFEAAS